MAVILLYALARVIFSVTPSKLPLKIFVFAAALEIAQYFGVVQILSIENKILKIMIGGTFDLTDLLCYANWLYYKLYAIRKAPNHILSKILIV